jgi:hypothetical protein
MVNIKPIDYGTVTKFYISDRTHDIVVAKEAENKYIIKRQTESFPGEYKTKQDAIKNAIQLIEKEV